MSLPVGMPSFNQQYELNVIPTTTHVSNSIEIGYNTNYNDNNNNNNNINYYFH